MNNIKRITDKERIKFLKKNNISSNKTPYISYALVEDEIKAILSLDASNRNEEFQWIINEFINLTERDLFEDIWNKFLKDKSCRSCVVEDGFLIKLMKSEGAINLGFYMDDGILIYYPFHVLYKAIDNDSDCFYIGMCENKKGWDKGYKGSGVIWNNHMNKHSDHNYSVEVLESNFKSPKELREAEYNEINKYCNSDGKVDHSTGCMNTHLRTQGSEYVNKECNHCGLTNGHHKKNCPRYKEPNKCEYCGSSFGKHKKDCPSYKDPGNCQECGYPLQSRRHSKSCSHYTIPNLPKKKCSECGGLAGQHRKGCSLYSQPEACTECGGIKGHRTSCSKYKRVKCQECGSVGNHKDFCSKSKGKCPECGYSLQSRKHSPECSKYTPLLVCSECGGRNNKHKAECSKYLKPNRCNVGFCLECGATGGTHKANCSKYVKCSECGSGNWFHKKGCPNNKKYVNSNFEPCEECGWYEGKHSDSCSKKKVKELWKCDYCDGKHGKHKKTCIYYVDDKPRCPECGKSHGHHEKTCSHNIVCEICGGSDNRHYIGCPNKNKYKNGEYNSCSNCGWYEGKHSKDCVCNGKSLRKLNARDCSIIELTKDEIKQFLNENHKQGYAYSTVQYGLYYKNELVYCMTFSRPRYNKHYQWEIIRECTKNGCIVRGATSKIWKHFLSENTVNSCICYSYPHNNKYTNHYCDYCGFKNIYKAKDAENIFFVGKWNGKNKKIAKSILERHGVDRLLKVDEGKDRSNEQIMLDLGFEKVVENGISPQLDSYFPYGVCYKLKDEDNGNFYIGCSYNKELFESEEFIGDSKEWVEYVNKNKSHSFSKEILKGGFDVFKTPKQMHDYCLKKIRDNFCLDENNNLVKNNNKCFNSNNITEDTQVCYECGGVLGKHNNKCSQYKR